VEDERGGEGRGLDRFFGGVEPPAEDAVDGGLHG
jgi:hypothetical protein